MRKRFRQQIPAVVGKLESLRLALFACLFGMFLSAQAQSLFPSIAFAGNDDCSECVSRKQKICSEECDEVEPARSIICQRRCIGGYCSHYCRSNAPELKALTEESCQVCQDRQYTLCETHCPTGTQRERSACQLKCSAERCEPRCKVNKEDEKLVPLPPERSTLDKKSEPKPQASPEETVLPSEDELEAPDAGVDGGV